MRLRKLWGPVAVAYCSLFLFGYLTFGLGGHDTLFSCIVNVVVLIVAGTLAVMRYLNYSRRVDSSANVWRNQDIVG